MEWIEMASYPATISQKCCKERKFNLNIGSIKSVDSYEFKRQESPIKINDNQKLNDKDSNNTSSGGYFINKISNLVNASHSQSSNCLFNSNKLNQRFINSINTTDEKLLKRIDKDFKLDLSQIKKIETEHIKKNAFVEYLKGHTDRPVTCKNPNSDSTSLVDSVVYINNKDRTRNLGNKQHISSNLASHYISNPKRFSYKVQSKPPKCFRWISWLTLCGISKLSNQLYYENLLLKELDALLDIQIKKDLHRTIFNEDNINNKEFQDCLYKVLKALAIADKETSYCQGMNYIVGLLLIISDFNECETFNLMITILGSGQNNKYGIRGLFIHNFPLLKFYCYCFDLLFKEKFSNLYNHFIELEIPQDAWICKWLQTLFCICLPLHLLTNVWDCIISRGLKFLLEFSLALIEIYEKDLLALEDSSDVLEYFRKHMSPYGDLKGELSFSFDEYELIRKAIDIDISEESMHNYLVLYESEYGEMENYKLEINLQNDNTPKKIAKTNYSLVDDLSDQTNNKILNCYNLTETHRNKKLMSMQVEHLNELDEEKSSKSRSTAPVYLDDYLSTEPNKEIREGIESNYLSLIDHELGDDTLLSKIKKRSSFISINDDYMNISRCSEIETGIDNKVLSHTFKPSNKTQNKIQDTQIKEKKEKEMMSFTISNFKPKLIDVKPRVISVKNKGNQSTGKPPITNVSKLETNSNDSPYRIKYNDNLNSNNSLSKFINKLKLNPSIIYSNNKNFSNSLKSKNNSSKNLTSNSNSSSKFNTPTMSKSGLKNKTSSAKSNRGELEKCLLTLTITTPNISVPTEFSTLFKKKDKTKIKESNEKTFSINNKQGGSAIK